MCYLNFGNYFHIIIGNQRKMVSTRFYKHWAANIYPYSSILCKLPYTNVLILCVEYSVPHRKDCSLVPKLLKLGSWVFFGLPNFDFREPVDKTGRTML